MNREEWLAIVGVVKKKNRKWGIFVDFTNLNKVCSKYKFELPSIGKLVDATARHNMLSLMDKYLGITRYQCLKMNNYTQSLSLTMEHISTK